MPVLPNFFLIGAPKCGTTSLAAWLSEHPNIFVSDPKEPSYFCKDLKVPSAPVSLDEYERIFGASRPHHAAVGEASTGYLRSRVAVPEILRYNPAAKFIVCIRNPIEMAPSVHKQHVKGGGETELDLKRAWDLQNQRKRGERLPRPNSNPERFQYQEICALGTQITRLLRTIPRSSVHFSLLEDMQENPRRTYLEILNFLNIPPDNKTDFRVYNERRKVRSSRIAKISYSLSEKKRRIGWTRGTGLGNIILNLNTTNDKNKKISKEMKLVLTEAFREEIKKLEIVLNRDLSHWLLSDSDRP